MKSLFALSTFAFAAIAAADRTFVVYNGCPFTVWCVLSLACHCIRYAEPRDILQACREYANVRMLAQYSILLIRSSLARALQRPTTQRGMCIIL